MAEAPRFSMGEEGVETAHAPSSQGTGAGQGRGMGGAWAREPIGRARGRGQGWGRGKWDRGTHKEEGTYRLNSESNMMLLLLGEGDWRFWVTSLSD